jgi:hypothetical protein
MGIFDRNKRDPELEIYAQVGAWRAKASHNLSTGHYKEALYCANEALKLDPKDRTAQAYKDAAEKELGI